MCIKNSLFYKINVLLFFADFLDIRKGSPGSRGSSLEKLCFKERFIGNILLDNTVFANSAAFV